MSENIFPGIVYLDTGIISHLAKNKQLWPKLADFLKQNDLALGVSQALVVELSDATGLHSVLAELFVYVPSYILKHVETIVAEEVKAHPKKRTETLVDPSNAPNGLHGLQEGLLSMFSSSKLHSMRGYQLLFAPQMPSRHAQLKKNFSPSKKGVYTRKQADKFADIQVLQWLDSTHHDFLMELNNRREDFHPEVFLSIRLFAHVIFYKYYLGRREPNDRSDFGDLYHLFPIPYCELVITERDLCEVLNQIKRNHDTLTSTAVYNIGFFNDWTWQR